MSLKQKISPSSRDSIIDDLLKKHPSGPEGLNPHYSYQSRYCYDRRRYCQTIVSSIPHCGYSDLTLFSLNIHTKEAARSYIMKRFFPDHSSWSLGRSKATVTRRTRRLWQRLAQAVEDVQSRGSSGIYKIINASRRDAGLGYIYASSLEEASIVMSTFFPELKKDNGYTIKFLELGTIDRLHEYNKKAQLQIEEKKKELMVEIRYRETLIEKLENHAARMGTLVGHQIACES